MTAKEINKKIQEMISSDSVPQDEIIRFVKGECQTVSLHRVFRERFLYQN